MSTDDFFQAIVEPALERLPQLVLCHEVVMERRTFDVCHAVARNVLTEFDQKLSDHMAAVTGTPLPAYTLTSTVSEAATGRNWTPYEARHFPSMPHALKVAAALCLGGLPEVDARLVQGTEPDELGRHLEITSTTVGNLDAALKICIEIGPTAFLRMTGDFDRISVCPRGADLDPVVLNLASGTITVPPAGGPSATAYQGALISFVDTVRRDINAGDYVARARHAVAGEKERAVLAFRAAAEGRIAAFDRALDGQPLEGFRLDAARRLVARLQAGLGPGLTGLSEAAQITALGWASHVGNVHAPALLTDDSDGHGTDHETPFAAVDLPPEPDDDDTEAAPMGPRLVT